LLGCGALLGIHDIGSEDGGAQGDAATMGDGRVDAKDGAAGDAAVNTDGASVADAGTDGSSVGDAVTGCDGGSTLTSDPLNCGLCGHSCLGKSCQNSVCASEVLVGQDLGANIYGLAIDDQALYWAAPLVNAVQSVPKAGGPLQALAPTDPDPGGITTWNGMVYWTQIFNGHIWGVPASGGNATILATTTTPVPDLGPTAADDSGVYFTDHNGGTGYLGSIPLDGGAVTVLGSLGGSINLALDATDVYWSAANVIQKVSKAGGQATVVANPAENVGNFAVDDTSLYWGPADTTTGLLRKIAKAGGGSPQTLAQNQGGIGMVRVDAQRVYWFSASLQRIMSASKVDGSDVLVLADNVTGANAWLFVIDDQYVYWFGAGDWIYRAPK
jgi:hypothetical protein